jgi:geranylgeranyl reductase family protein
MNYDVVVVGAGPAGATAAKILAEKKIKVLLIDKEEFPREKICGGGLPTRVQKRFPYIEKFIDSISYGSITYSSSLRYKLDLLRDKPLLAMILRSEFDQGLLNYAQEAGATVLCGKPVVDITIKKDNALVLLDDGQTIETQLVIGCDGTRSIVAEKTDLCKKLENICVCLIQEQPMTAKQLDTYFTKKRKVHLFIKAQGIAGYGWLFPKRNCVNIGLGEFSSAVDPTKPKKNLKDVYETFIKTLKEQNILPKEFPIANLKGGLLPIFPLEKTYADRVLLCGDAAGFINPITGEGVYYAMTSGAFAAEVAAEALKTGDTSEHVLSRYQILWKKEFGKDLELLGRFNKQWGKDSEKIVRLLTRDKQFAKLVIGVIGGQISFSKHIGILFLRYLYASLKDIFGKKE